SNPDLLTRRNLHALPRPARMRAYLRRLAQPLASFVAVERPRKAKMRPTSPVTLSAWEVDSYHAFTTAPQVIPEGADRVIPEGAGRVKRGFVPFVLVDGPCAGMPKWARGLPAWTLVGLFPGCCQSRVSGRAGQGPGGARPRQRRCEASLRRPSAIG